MKSIVLAFLVCLFSLPGTAQIEQNSSDSSGTTSTAKPQKDKKYTGKRTFVGGGLGLSFYNDGGYFNGSLMLGYNLTKSLQVAGRVSYWYLWGHARTPNNRGTEKYNSNIYAFSVPFRYVLWKGIFLHAEPEYMNLPQYQWVYDATHASGYSLEGRRVDAFNFYVGGGAYLQFTGNSEPFFSVLWNLNQTNNSFYSNPYWQVGYAIGF